MAEADGLLDLGDAGFRGDPYPVLAAVRALGPLPRHDGLGARVAASYDVVQDVLRSRDLGRTYTLRVPRPGRPAGEWDTFNALHEHALLEVEPPTHTRLRRLVARAFGRGHVERLRPRVAELAAGLLDGCAETLAVEGSFDVVEGYAEPLPVLVVAELLGWPAEDRHLLRPWSQAIVAMYELDPTPEAEAAAREAADGFAAYVAELARARSRRPTDDLVSDLVAVRDAGDRLSEAELVATVVLLLNAGHEASVNGFGNGLVSWLAAGSARRRRRAAGRGDAAPRRPAAALRAHRPAPLHDRGRRPRAGRARRGPAGGGQPRPGAVRPARGLRPDPDDPAPQLRRRPPLLRRRTPRPPRAPGRPRRPPAALAAAGAGLGDEATDVRPPRLVRAPPPPRP